MQAWLPPAARGKQTPDIRPVIFTAPSHLSTAAPQWRQTSDANRRTAMAADTGCQAPHRNRGKYRMSIAAPQWRQIPDVDPELLPENLPELLLICAAARRDRASIPHGQLHAAKRLAPGRGAHVQDPSL